MTGKQPCFDTRTARQPGDGGIRCRRQKGLTAIEVMVSLVVLSVVTAFSLQALEFTRRAQLEVDQLDFATQTARDILNQLRQNQDWRSLQEAWSSGAEGPGGSFTVQIMGEAGEEPGVSDVEVTLIWVGPKGQQQQVFNTSVLEDPATP